MTQLQASQMLTAEDRFAHKLAARLSEGTNELPHDISERLRVARMQALAKRKMVPAMRTATVVLGQGGVATLSFDNETPSWWNRIASALPIFALVAGLLTIYVVQNDNRTDELAEVDSALLTDDLPTAAYTDPGFIEFLKTSRDTTQ
jgi:hypothetical protein